MKDVILQIWEYSSIKHGQSQDGCSLHIDFGERDKYISGITNKMPNYLPDSYDRPVGEPARVFITPEVYNILTEEKTIRLLQSELNNLFNLQDIILKN